MRERRPLDTYYTPDDLALSLVGLLDIRPGALVWEPHVGGGAFARALALAGATVTISDLDPTAPALQPGALPALGPSFVGDFLSYAPSDDEPRPDWIVGNPPFTGFEAHVEHALAWAPRVAFLLRLAAMESASRVARWRRWPLRRVWVLAERPSFTGGGTDSAAYGWFEFKRGWEGERAEVIPGWSWRRGAA